MYKDFLIRSKLGQTKNYPSKIRQLKNSILSHGFLKDNVTLLSIGTYSLYKGQLVRGDLSQELLWAANIIEAYENKIKSFLEKKKNMRIGSLKRIIKMLRIF